MYQRCVDIRLLARIAAALEGVPAQPAEPDMPWEALPRAENPPPGPVKGASASEA